MIKKLSELATEAFFLSDQCYKMPVMVMLIVNREHYREWLPMYQTRLDKLLDFARKLKPIIVTRIRPAKRLCTFAMRMHAMIRRVLFDARLDLELPPDIPVDEDSEGRLTVLKFRQAEEVIRVSKELLSLLINLQTTSDLNELAFCALKILKAQKLDVASFKIENDRSALTSQMIQLAGAKI